MVRLHGDLDARSADATGRRLVRRIDAGSQVLEVDLTHVTHLSPDGCQALFTALRAARARGTRLVVTNADDPARSVLHRIGIFRALSEGNSDVR
ncbi:STAS domain-containing protein [Streptomyces europaeiscabiei]|uniref:STAS domain-containing protein n=1 Tax=Streptomyces europaeiscabiei TaxID=146819 RepID=UPI0029A26611|nr:STAS domain-containing protein [Streptomyces europaeiscabiei]MDX3784081.1 STAS domain-containing protein [Streptomyces europaeiscabiei]